MLISLDETRRIGDALNINWDTVNDVDFRDAINIEYSEHRDVTLAARIAIAHLREMPDYYKLMATLDSDSDLVWAACVKPSLISVQKYRAAIWLAIAVIAILIIIAGYTQFQYNNRKCSSLHAKYNLSTNAYLLHQTGAGYNKPYE